MDTKRCLALAIVIIINSCEKLSREDDGTVFEDDGKYIHQNVMEDLIEGKQCVCTYYYGTRKQMNMDGWMDGYDSVCARMGVEQWNSAGV